MKRKIKNAIVTGGSGFIGRALTRRLKKEIEPGGQVLSLSSSALDLTDAQGTIQWFEERARELEITHVFHLAALYKAGDWPVKHPATQFYANMSINVNLLEAWFRACPKARLTSVLSYCMYPSTPDPHPESELYGTEPEDYLFAYALAKKVLLTGQRAYRVEHDLDATSVVLPTVFGPDDSFAENSHVVGALIGKFVRAARDHHPSVEVWGDGLQEREFAYVEDIVEGILRACHHSTQPVLNLGTGQAHSIQQLVAWIREASGFTGEIENRTDRFVGVQRRVMDNRLLQEELIWSPETPMPEAIAKTVDWYRSTLEAETLTPKAKNPKHDSPVPNG